MKFSKNEEKKFFVGATAPSGPEPPHYRGWQLHSDTPHSVGLLWLSDQPDAEISDNTQHSQETDINPVGLKPTIPASERLRSNGITKFSGAPGKKKLGLSISKITNCLGIKIVYWISFYLGQSLKIYWVQKINFFHLKYSFLLPLDPVTQGGCTIHA